MFKYISKLLYILPTKKRNLILLLSLFIITSIIEAFGIGIIGPFMALASKPELIHQNLLLDRFFHLFGFKSDNQFIILIGLLVIISFCLKSFFAWFTQVSIFKFSIKQQELIAIKLVREYLGASYIFHAKTNSAHIINNVLEIFNELSVAVLVPSLSSISNLIIALFLFILLCQTNIAIVGTISFVLLPLVLLFNHFKEKLKKWGQQTRLAKEEIIRVINHGLGSIKETRIIGCEFYFNNQMQEQAKLCSQSVNKYFAFKISPRYIVETVMLVSLVGVITVFFSLNQSIEGLTSILGIFALASIRLIPVISNFVSGMSTLRNSSFIITKLYSTLKELEVTANQNSGKANYDKLPRCLNRKFQDEMEIVFEESITLDNISYSYNNAIENAISNITLTIPKGQSVAFIGKSGAGKTTLVDVILGLLTPQNGDLRVDSVSVYSNLQAWQKLIGYIPQSIFLSDDTIEKNIAFGTPDHLINEQKLHMAIQAAQLTEVIENLPDGVKTRVGERGILLSGGQRQRVGIARALYHEREVLVLDEATAALDNETESLVTEAIKSLGRSKTIIIIAHRLTTVRHCDRIYLLEKGRIVKSGSYQEVVLEDSKPH